MAKEIVEEGKALLKSKTFYFNVLFVLVFIASFFGFDEFKPDAKVLEVLASLQAIGNVLLRLKTSEPITRLK